MSSYGLYSDDEESDHTRDDDAVTQSDRLQLGVRKVIDHELPPLLKLSEAHARSAQLPQPRMLAARNRARARFRIDAASGRAGAMQSPWA